MDYSHWYYLRCLVMRHAKNIRDFKENPKLVYKLLKQGASLRENIEIRELISNLIKEELNKQLDGNWPTQLDDEEISEEEATTQE